MQGLVPPKHLLGGPSIRIIAAVASNGVIGLGGQLPWSIEEDRKWLLENIKSGVFVYGRRSFQETGRPLPGVHSSVVVTRGLSSGALPDVHTAPCFDDAVVKARELAGTERNIWIGGGCQLFREALPVASQLFLTKVSLVSRVLLK